MKKAQLAREERIRIEKECLEVEQLIRGCRAELENAINEYIIDYLDTFNNAFEQMSDAQKNNDINKYISGANKITEKLNGKVPCRSFDEFEANIINNPEPFIL